MPCFSNIFVVQYFVSNSALYLHLFISGLLIQVIFLMQLYNFLSVPFLDHLADSLLSVFLF